MLQCYIELPSSVVPGGKHAFTRYYDSIIAQCVRRISLEFLRGRCYQMAGLGTAQGLQPRGLPTLWLTHCPTRAHTAASSLGRLELSQKLLTLVGLFSRLLEPMILLIA